MLPLESGLQFGLDLLAALEYLQQVGLDLDLVLCGDASELGVLVYLLDEEGEIPAGTMGILKLELWNWISCIDYHP